MNEDPSQGNHLHGGHVAMLLGLVFWAFFVLQPYIDPTPENLPTKKFEQTDNIKKENSVQEKDQEKQR